MQVRMTEFHRFVNGESIFTIPVYQRNYDWTKENCQRLFYDILSDMISRRERGKQHNHGHYIGNFIYNSEGRYNNVIVDGQQRLTTLMLMLKALHDSTNNEQFKRRIKIKYLVNEFLRDEIKIKLKPIKHDRPLFDKLISSDNFSIKDYTDGELKSNVMKNYMLLSELISQNITEDDCDDFLNSIEQLEIVEYELDDENPQVIFESINSTGKDLTNTDLLRNYILMSLPSEDQESIYNDYWSKIEDTVGANNVETFMICYMLLKLKSNSMSFGGKQHAVSSKTLYECFKQLFPYLNRADISHVSVLMQEVLHYAEYYSKFLFTNVEQAHFHGTQKQLFELFYCLDQKDAAPHVMYLTEHLHSGLITEQTYSKVLDIFISYATRCVVCKRYGFKQQIAYWIQKVDEELEVNTKIKKDLLVGKDYEYVSMWWKVVTGGKGGYSFPKNVEFQSAIEDNDLYGSINSKRCKYILLKIEESHNAKECLSFTDGSIEHIMPRTLSTKWKNALNLKKDLVNYESCVNTLGNLTLTGYNSELSNDFFDEKCENYRVSNYCITRDVAKYKEWTSESIKTRAKKLSTIAVDLWPLPNEYNKKYSVDTGVTCDFKMDFNSFIGTKPGVISIENVECSVTNWSDVVFEVCKALYRKDPKLFIETLETKKMPGKKQYLYEEKPDAVRVGLINENPQYYIMAQNHVEDNLLFLKTLIESFDEVNKSELMDEIWFTLRST